MSLIGSRSRSFRRLGNGLLLLLLLAAGACGSRDATAPDLSNGVSSVLVSPDSLDVRVGESVQLSATPRDAEGRTVTGATVTWSTSDAGRASVSNTGLVTGVAVGRVVITVSAGGRTSTAVIQVRAPVHALSGTPDAPAVGVVPRRVAITRDEDFSRDHPDLGTMAVSFNTVSVLVDAGATVGAVNALLATLEAELIGGSPGVPGSVPGFLVLRLPTTNHAEMAAALRVLRGDPAVVVASVDVQLGTSSVPVTSAHAFAADWNWALLNPLANPPEGNWGLKQIRVPQLWNFNDLVRRDGRDALTGILDEGFSPHDDLLISEHRGPVVEGPHGTHVAGIIGATFDNGIGVDGVNPFARMVTQTSNTMTTAAALTAIADLLSGQGSAQPLRVVNISQGYLWKKDGVDPSVSPSSQEIVRDHALIFRSILLAEQSNGRPLPVFVVSAGNDGEAFYTARWNSAWSHAGLALGVRAVIPVESLALVGGTLALALSSNTGGLLSAPGGRVMSTVTDNGYARFSGTSMAAPHVAGLVGYLYAMDPEFPAPTLTENPMLDLLLASAVPAFGAAPRIDAFSAALELDRRRGGRFLVGLLDIDDGTLDGNTRVDLATGDTILGNRPGARDGVVDIRDFRRFRDWLLQAEGAGGQLNGAADHLKKDLNGDAWVGTLQEENAYPRADFNGDGILSATATAPVGGVFGGAELTDLEVFQRLFQDPLFSAADLPGLLNSGDVDVHPVRCLAIPGTAEVRVALRRGGEDASFRIFPLTTTAPRRILTEPTLPDGYTIRLEARSDSGEELGIYEQDFGFAPGSDARFDPECFRIDAELTFPEEVTAGTPSPLTVNATITNPVSGDEVPAAGADVSITVIGGVAAEPFGALDANGNFTTEVTPEAGVDVLTIIVEVDTPNGSTSVMVTRDFGLRIVSSVLPVGTPGYPYRHWLVAEGAEGPRVWQAVADLPSWLTLRSDGFLNSNSAPADGEFPFRVRVTVGERSASRTVTAVIDGSVLRLRYCDNSVNPCAYDTVLSGRPFARQYREAAVGAFGVPRSYTRIGGTLPPGLTLDPSTGDLAGVPTDGGLFTFRIRISAGDQAVEFEDRLGVVPGVETVIVWPEAYTMPVNTGIMLEAYTRDRDGNPLGRPVTWSSNNTQVATVDREGIVAARSVGTATITATSEERSGSATITVVEPPNFTYGIIPLSPSATGIVGEFGPAQLVHTGGTGQVRWSIVSGTFKNEVTITEGGVVTARCFACASDPIIQGRYAFQDEVFVLRVTDELGYLMEREVVLWFRAN